MMKLLKYGLIILVFCNPVLGQNNEKSDVLIVDLTKLPKNENQINLSEFASEIIYLPLESPKEYLIGPSANFYLHDSLIVCSAHHQILTFNSTNGKFVKAIGEFGRGPNGFRNSRDSYIKNGEIVITAIGWNHPLLEFSANGEVLHKIKPERYPRDIAWLVDNLYAIYYYKNSNSDNIKLQVYDSSEDKTISTFYDYRKFKDTPNIDNFGAFFYRYGNRLFIKEYFNDTAFQVTPKKLIPTTVFKSGKFSPPFYEKETFNFVEYHNVNTILETDNLLFFQLVFNKRIYCCYFDKRNNQLMIPNYESHKINGFKNDLDGFMPFQPTSISSNNKVLIGFLEPYEIIQWFEENSQNAAKLSPKLQKFKNINENNNPVLMLVKLKE